LSRNRTLLVATHNQDKLREIRAILAGSGWDVLGLDSIAQYPEPEETGETFVENSLLKAREGYHRSKILTVADDSGLEVDALDGRPGVLSARYAGPNSSYADLVAKLLSEMRGIPADKRTARFHCAMSLVGEGTELSWDGSVEGTITTEVHGTGGFGYDPVFYSQELGKTFAEATPEEKNRVSHRGKALQQLRGHLDLLATVYNENFW
jgi:XTP/dITP diphosphohydrolase